MQRMVIGLSVVALSCVLPSTTTPAVAAESELLLQFRLYLKSPANWREDEELLLESALRASDPKLRELADERRKALGVRLPRNFKDLKVNAHPALSDARLAFDLIFSLESASQKQLAQTSLTHAQVQALVKAGKTQGLPEIFVAANERVPALKRIHQAKLVEYYEAFVKLQKTSSERIAVMLKFDSSIVDPLNADRLKMGALRRKYVQRMLEGSAAWELEHLQVHGVLQLDSELLAGFRLPRPLVEKSFRKMLDDKDKKVRAVARQFFAASSSDDGFLAASLSGALRDNVVPQGGLHHLLEHIEPKHVEAKAYVNRFYAYRQPVVRSELIATIERIRKTDRETLKYLGDNLVHDDVHLQVHSRLALRNLGVMQKVLNEDLIPALGSKNAAAIKSAARRLQSLGRIARPAKSSLEKLLTHADEGVRFRAAAALYRSFDESARYRPQMIKALDAKQASIRLDAIRTLTEYGPAPERAIPVLLKRLSDPDDRVAAAAIDALQHVAAR